MIYSCTCTYCYGSSELATLHGNRFVPEQLLTLSYYCSNSTGIWYLATTMNAKSSKKRTRPETICFGS